MYSLIRSNGFCANIYISFGSLCVLRFGGHVAHLKPSDWLKTETDASNQKVCLSLPLIRFVHVLITVSFISDPIGTKLSSSR